jgi:hypothetical protein
VRSSLISLLSSLTQAVTAVIPSRSSSNSRNCTRRRAPHPTSCGLPFRSHAAQRPRACSYVPSVVRTRRVAWSVVSAGGRYVPGTAGTSFFLYLLVGTLMGACASVYRLDAEWVMDKRDWKEAQRREKAAATGEKIPTPGESASASPQSPSSSPSSGANTQASTDDPGTNAYPPEMDEMRCLLWAHGGLDPYPSCSGSPGCLLCIPSHAGGYYFGSVNQERYSTIAKRFACSSPGLENAGI